MIQLHRTFFSTSTSVPSSHTLSLRHFMLQFRALQPPINALSPHASSVITGTTFQCRRTCLLFPRGVTAKRIPARSFAVKSTTLFGDYFGFPFAANCTTPFDHGLFSKGFSTRVGDSGKQGKRVKAVVVRGKEKDGGVVSDAASGKEEVAKTAKKKSVKKKKPSPKKKVSAASNSEHEECVAEVSGKSTKLKRKKVSKKSSADSAIEEIVDNSASVKDELKKQNGNSILIEEAKPLWSFTHKPLYPPSGKSVVVVESVTKAKVIKGYLGDMYEVLPSYGHVRDLAARSGSVRPDEDFSMVWEVPAPAWTHLKSIKVALSGAENLILASDPDREGEAIAWHIIEMLQQQGALHDNISLARVVFQEITEKSVKGALQTPRQIDINLVQAYLARRALDYLIGFNISPLLWRKLPGCQSAGRVQSAALALICDREMEIDEFKSKEYWTVEVQLKKEDLGSNTNFIFPARLTHFDSKKLNQFSITSDAEARHIQSNIDSANFHVVCLKKSKTRRNPPTPYITSTLQQDAANKLHFTASHTMKLAQKLYEGVELSDGVAVGLITYIRTDGFHISDEAVANIRSLIIERYGQDFAAQSAPKYFKKVKNAQEAHEAIRPTDIRKLPSMLAGILDEESLKLYTLIWSRTVSCQMEPAVIEQIHLDIGNGDKSIVLRTASSMVEFPGYQAVYTDVVAEAVHDKDRDDSSPDKTFGVLNSLKTGDPLCVVQTEPCEHHTQPPPRYSEASLVKKLEELGIGRPSTYASTIKVLRDRNYVTVKNRVLSPEFRGRMVSAFLSHHFSEVTDYSFTADMETELDNVSAGLTEWKGLLRDYWTRFKSYCERTSNVHIHQVEKMLEKKFGDFLFASLPDQNRVCPSCMEGTLIFKVSRFGAGYFIGCDQHPTCKYIAKTLYGTEEEEDSSQPSTRVEEPKLLGVTSGSNEKVLLKTGPYGFYVQLGDDRKGYIPKRASVSHVKDVGTITLEDALELLQYPLTLGNHPKDGQPVILKLARVGFSVRHRRTIASVPKNIKPTDVTLEKALEFLSGKDVRRSGRPKGKSKAQVEVIEAF
ncbi:uncharacterized protein HKW66_Vig0003750 [Vigna angularis]|uniref:DNA topoisomerase n=2 Tax=Phaseolus angularis TaxID=3914 RepID=A0A8T0LA88_PHAAN|nr:uncharacterized protein LOC108347888 [Vigna angularis]KAG2409710.1 uncharacterized protein HKW66_Vig0003750 [Vigna angularis]BAT74274.1 hypothetical protein VIGAN_01190800 [Vigna angularis var. angularis]